jgi:hypothetical protein
MRQATALSGYTRRCLHSMPVQEPASEMLASLAKKTMSKMTVQAQANNSNNSDKIQVNENEIQVNESEIQVNENEIQVNENEIQVNEKMMIKMTPSQMSQIQVIKKMIANLVSMMRPQLAHHLTS